MKMKIAQFEQDSYYAGKFAAEDMKLIYFFFNQRGDQPHIQKAPLEIDKRGGDYIADYIAKDGESRRDFVDVKRRRRGASRYWKGGEPDLPVEIGYGWTFKLNSVTNWLIFAFDADDYPVALCCDYQDFRRVAEKNFNRWKRLYRARDQTSERRGRRYQSQVIFVPLSEFTAAGVEFMRLKKE